MLLPLVKEFNNVFDDFTQNCMTLLLAASNEINHCWTAEENVDLEILEESCSRHFSIGQDLLFMG